MIDTTSRGSLWSALVEETALRDPGLVLGGDLNVGRREQEDPVGHPLHRTPQAERESRREVHQTLGVRLRHLGEIHDHRYAVTEVLTDRTCLVIRRGVQRG